MHMWMTPHPGTNCAQWVFKKKKKTTKKHNVEMGSLGDDEGMEWG